MFNIVWGFVHYLTSKTLSACCRDTACRVREVRVFSSPSATPLLVPLAKRDGF